METIGQASASLELSLEYVPWTLPSWLADHLEAVPRVDQALAHGAAFMSARGLVHFDAHFRNLLTDGLRQYFANFRLAWIAGHRRSVSDYERLPRHHEAMVRWAVIRITSRRLTQHQQLGNSHLPCRLRSRTGDVHPG